MFRIVLAALGACLVTGAAAQDLNLPTFTADDSWVYHQTVQQGDKQAEYDAEISVVRSDDQGLVVSVKAVGSTRPPVEAKFKPDWARFRSVNGVETLVGRPLAFPLALGKTWKVNYSENNPDPQHAREEVDITYEVGGWEDVTTPAGAFKALKIEGKGSWMAESPARGQTNSDPSSGPERATGQLYRVVWYVPEVKRWVKSRDETLTSTGQVTHREESDLKTFHVAPTSPAPAK
jgi:hypothetical protein